MDFKKFATVSICLFLCPILQAFDSTSGIYVNHAKWLQYSRALPNNLNDDTILSANDPRHFLKPNNVPCDGCPEGCEPSSGARGSGADEAETPMSLLNLNLPDVDVPFKVIRDVLGLEPRDEGKAKFLTEKAIIFSFVNKTVLRSIQSSEKVNASDDPMIIALFLPVEYRLTKCEGKSAVSGHKPMAASEDKDSEWPQFFTSLLKEMVEANVTSQNLLEALLNDSGSDELPDIDSEPVSNKGVHPETMKLMKEKEFQDTNVILYFFRAPHVGIPSKYVKQILKEVDIPLTKPSLSKFEVNEVYLMTVANETASKHLKDVLRREKCRSSHGSKTTPVVLSFIIPIEFNSNRQGKSSVPRAKMSSNPLQVIADTPRNMNDASASDQNAMSPAATFQSVPLPLIPYIPVPLLLPYQQMDSSIDPTKMIVNPNQYQYTQQLNASGNGENALRLIANGNIIHSDSSGSPIKRNGQSESPSSILQPSLQSNVFGYQKASPRFVSSDTNSAP